MHRVAFVFGILAAMPAGAEVLATRTLAAGTVIGFEDLAPSPDAALSEVDGLIGLQTRTIIYEGRPVALHQLAAPLVVERNQMVVLAYEAGPLSIRTEGRALGAGAAGDVIRVMNMTSRTTVQATIREDGVLAVSAR